MIDHSGRRVQSIFFSFEGMSYVINRIITRAPDWGSRPNTLADEPVFVPRLMICPFFRAMRHLLGGIRHTIRTQGMGTIKFYWGLRGGIDHGNSVSPQHYRWASGLVLCMLRELRLA